MAKRRHKRNSTFQKYQQLSTLLFADDQIITRKNEDNSQKPAYKLNKTITEHGLTMSVQKTKLMVFKG
jgi:hypothetical protein